MRKRFGQNFLHDLNIIDRIVSCINPKNSEHLIEIGPGLGALTTSILPVAQKLDVIELDRDLIPGLKANCETLGDLTVYQSDAMTFDFSSLINSGEKLRVFGNLPYNVATQIIFHLLAYANHITDMYFMLQKEVAERLAAKVSEPAYGRLGIVVQYYCKVELLFFVSPESFKPRPKVTSAFVRLVPHEMLPYPAKKVENFSQVVKIAFMQRRKTLKNALKKIISAEDLEKLDIDPSLRPEQISLEQYVKISDYIN